MLWKWCCGGGVTGIPRLGLKKACNSLFCPFGTLRPPCEEIPSNFLEDGKSHGGRASTIPDIPADTPDM